MSYQKCPLCNGTGQYNQFNTGIISGVCPVCKGQRIISELNGLPPRPNFGQELIKDNDDIDSQYKPEDFAEYKKWLYGKKDIEEMTFTAKEYNAWLEGNRKTAKAINGSKELTDNLFDITKSQNVDDVEKYNYIKERLDTTGRASIRQDEFDFVQEFEKKADETIKSNLEHIKSTSSVLKDLES